jgi:RNA polymerase sigma-70 factor (ECF subfamily)
MANHNEVQTSQSLLEALREGPPNGRAWDTFQSRYLPLVKDWCRRWGLNQVDTEDAVQDLLVKLLAKNLVRQYKREGRFRDWLRKVVHSVVRDGQRALQRRPGAQGHGGPDVWLQQIEDPEEALALALTEGLDRRTAEAQRIIAAVKAKVDAKTWEAFELRALHGLPGKVVAERLRMPVGSVRQARYSVGRLLQKELRKSQGLGRNGGCDA